MKIRPTAICAALMVIVAALPLTSLAEGVETARVQETVTTARFKKAAPYRVGVAAGYLSNSWVVFCLQHIRYEAARHKEISERSEEHTSELQSQSNLVCRLLLEKKKNRTQAAPTIA